jgi:hypothetical protein
MRLITVLMVAVAVMMPSGEAQARRPAVRGSVRVPDYTGGVRPYCYVLDVEPARYARKICRRIGGEPYSVRQP